jgi:hypothetical protein
VNYSDVLGLAKQLQADINNKNTFLIELVSRRLDLKYISKA